MRCFLFLVLTFLPMALYAYEKEKGIGSEEVREAIIKSEFTEQLKKDVAKQFDEFAQNDCKHEEEMPCGYTFNIETCSPDDTFVASSLLKIIKIENVRDSYIVDASWGYKPATYKIMKEGKDFLIDGIICRFDDGDIIKFNWR
ncbi:MAG: hypothetical protein EBR02_03330 [Alphaproteobacteria bacterium]|nr:hypothetical protein [Alphaproteobacteria bacterium]